MATSEVSKYSVYDPRVVQTKPKYAVEKGALSLTNVSFNAQTANSTSQQFNVIVPSENVFIDRAVDWVSSGMVTFDITLSGAPANGQPLFSPGVDIALAAFPSHQCVAQMTATINDATVTVNTADVLNYVLRLQDIGKNRKQRTCPTMLDRYAVEQNAISYPNSPLGGFTSRYSSDEEPNGAFSQWWFTDAAGAPLATGVPVTANNDTAYTVYIRWQSTEKLLLPPFIFGDSHELSTGLFGVQNFQVQMNMTPTPARAIRFAASLAPGAGKQYQNQATNGVVTIGAITQPVWVTGGIGAYVPYPVQPALSVQFLTPALDVPLPPKSIVPYMEFPRYITTGISAIPTTLNQVQSSKGVQSGSVQVQSNTITLPNIPDLLLMYLKPAAAGTATFSAEPETGVGTSWSSFIGDFTLPIQAISINFDNFSGLLANHTKYQLYKMSVNNGLEMDYAEWSGESKASVLVPGVPNAFSRASTGQGALLDTNCLVSTVGGPLVLRPGRDFALQAGQAPGLVGNFTLQVNLTVGNQFAQAIAAGGVNLYIVPISSGFFETIKGSSRIIKGVLTEQDILSAPPHAPDEELQRKVGAAKSMSKSHAKHMSADAIYG